MSGSLIVAPGASFAQTFAGQTVSGIGISGQPSAPLSLAPSGNIVVGWFGVDTLLSQPDNTAPLSILLDTTATSFSWTMGAGTVGGSIEADLFSADGSLVSSEVISMLSGYNTYSLSGLGTFDGITFHTNTDPAGVQFLSMSYAAAPGGGTNVPEPSSALLIAIGLVGLSLRHARRA